jgi:hypothetical protein
MRLAAVRGDDVGVRVKAGDFGLGVVRFKVKGVEIKGVEPEGDAASSCAMSNASSSTCITSSSARLSNELVNAIVRTCDFPLLASTALDVDSGRGSYSLSTSAV